MGHAIDATQYVRGRIFVQSEWNSRQSRTIRSENFVPPKMNGMIESDIVFTYQNSTYRFFLDVTG